jgi:hypothetical protein
MSWRGSRRFSVLTPFAYLTRGEQITDQRMLSIPCVSVRIRKRPPYAPLSNLRVKEIAQTGKVFHIRFESKSSNVARVCGDHR